MDPATPADFSIAPGSLSHGTSINCSTKCCGDTEDTIAAGSSKPTTLSRAALEVFDGMSSLQKEKSAMWHHVSIPALSICDAVCCLLVVASRHCENPSSLGISISTSAVHSSDQCWGVKMLAKQLQMLPKCDQTEFYIWLFPWVSGNCSQAVREHDPLPLPKSPEQSCWNIANLELLLWDPGGSTLSRPLIYLVTSYTMRFLYCEIGNEVVGSWYPHMQLTVRSQLEESPWLVLKMSLAISKLTHIQCWSWPMQQTGLILSIGLLVKPLWILIFSSDTCSADENMHSEYYFVVLSMSRLTYQHDEVDKTCIWLQLDKYLCVSCHQDWDIDNHYFTSTLAWHSQWNHIISIFWDELLWLSQWCFSGAAALSVERVLGVLVVSRSVRENVQIILTRGSGRIFYQLVTWWSYKREKIALLWSQQQEGGKSATLMLQVARFDSQMWIQYLRSSNIQLLLWFSSSEVVAEVMQVNVELLNSSFCQEITNHEDLGNILNNGLRASRFSSGGECHVLGWMALGAGRSPSTEGLDYKGCETMVRKGRNRTRTPESSSSSDWDSDLLLFLLLCPDSLLIPA